MTTTVAHRDGLGTAALVIIRVIALWVLAGALFKLLLGTPADLPSVVRELPLDLGLTYRLAISVELAFVALGLFLPRVAWPFLASLLAVFCVVLVMLAAKGDANCGCFGSKITIPPLAMLGIDLALLGGLLATRPWRLAPKVSRAMAALVAVPLLAGLAAPWAVDRQAGAGPAEGGPERAKALPQYAILTPTEWVGSPLSETELAPWIDLGAMPRDGRFIFYRMTCEHCAEHLFEATAMDDGTVPFVLVRIIEEGEREEDFVVELVPEGEHVTHVTLPEDVAWVITTPAEFTLEDGVVVHAEGGA